ncbi:MAG: hypothetical protein GTO55_04235 [Armatimonadetes bacterium]|nr:hypothetical protein [Armatimonadota bacterium]NIM23480.1 hypothetical protein [Armatimonadota bacterium]NIM67346.1 hypothetical protein [Armatimonadota bacterium]NIM75847.1 hypothetical protein [Armatimonadota bacterium]NIN05532.1 hypothetical protein [Armatimonadota bacterium]
MNVENSLENGKANIGIFRSLPWWAILLAGLFVFLLSAGIRLFPLLTAPPKVSPDALEYLNIARHLDRGEGLVISIKAHMFDQEPVVRSTIGDRCFLYPAAVAAGLLLFPKSDDLLVARSVNLIFSSLAVTVSLFLFAGLFGWRVGGLAAILVAVNPTMVKNGIEPLSDQLFLLLALSALLLYTAQDTEHTLARWSPAAAGVVCALAQLTRPVGVVLLAVLLVGYLLRKRRRAAGWMMLGFLIVMSPYFWANWRQHGSPFYSVSAYNYTVGHYREGTWYGLDREQLSPWQFVSRNHQRVLKLVERKFVDNSKVVLNQLEPLLLFVLLLPRGAFRNSRGALIGYASLNFIAYSLSWAPVGAPRFLLPSYLLPIPFLLEAAARPRWMRLRKAGSFLLATAFVLAAGNSLVQDAVSYSRSFAAGKPTRFTEAYQQAALWLERETAPNEIVASNNPWEVNYRSNRPAVICPVFSKEEQIGPFLKRHEVRTVILFATSQDPRAEMLTTPAGREEVRLVSDAATDDLPLLIYRTTHESR